jgi:protein O-mannosyl-transferase
MSERKGNEPRAAAGAAGGAADWADKPLARWLICWVLALATLAVFFPARHHDFISYDDPAYVTANGQVQRGLTRAGLGWAWRTGHAGNWHPVTWMSHMLDCELFGLRAGGHHLVSAGLHAVNTALLFLLLSRMTGATWRSAAVAALFGLHPLHVESVAWVSERKDVLSAFFFLLTLWAYCRYAEIRSPKAEASITHYASRITHRPSFYYALTLVFFVFSLLSKPMVVTTPLVLLLLDYWPLRRWGSNASKLSKLAELIKEKLPFLALSVVSSMLTWRVQRGAGAFSVGLSFGERLGNALIAYVRYIGKMFWPENLSVFYPHPVQWPAWQILGAAALLGLVSVTVLVLRRRRPYLVVGWLWYLGMLVPVIGLVQVGSQSMADRYTYLPLIGLFVMGVWGISEALSPGPGQSQVLTVGTVSALAGCVVLTTRQLEHWQNDETLFGYALVAAPNNFLAHQNLGLAQLKRGQAGEAIAHLREAVRLAPGSAEAQKDLGSALFEDGQIAEAIIHFRKALELRPGFAEAHNSLGIALFKKGQLSEAIVHFRKALQAKPDLAEARNNLGDALQRCGQVDEAIAQFQEALALQPDNAVACNNLGAALRRKGQLNEAIAQYRKALTLRPDFAEAHNNLANALERGGRVEEAIVHFETALKLQPDNATIHDNFGKLLLSRGQVDAAIGQYRKALEIQPADAEAWSHLHHVAWVLATCPQPSRRNGARAVELAQQLNQLASSSNVFVLGTLAAAYAEAGRFAEAVTAAEHALGLATSQTNSLVAEALRGQLALYRAGSPYRDAGLAGPDSAPSVK